MKRPESKLKDKAWEEYVTKLEEELKKLKSSPYYQSYKTILGQIENWNQQLSITGEETTLTIGYTKEGEPIKEKRRKGEIDLFADKDTKDFDRAIKYFGEVFDLLEKLDKLRGKMSPDEKRALEEQAAMDGAGVIERFLTQQKNK